ncbi:MAG: hypothetical protein EB116_13465 [Betaproteobacteria bacterium]|nr:hypothetical protein [Betaproteobacteria bacterium]
MNATLIYDVLAIKPKLELYHATKSLRLTPAEVNTLQAAAVSLGIPRTDWWCATCAVGRLSELIAHAEHCVKEREVVFNVNDNATTKAKR